MKPYKLALLTGTHQHRWAGDHSGLCEKCHKEHQGHQYNSSNPGECRICGATGKCSHSDGFRSKGNENHACKVCYLEFPHELEIIGEQFGCRKCEVCNVVFGHKFKNGVCEACGYVCTHTNTSPGVSSEYHICTTCGTRIAHTFVDSGMVEYCKRCSGCGQFIAHTGIYKLDDVCTRCGYKHVKHIYSSNRPYCVICNNICQHEYVDGHGQCIDCLHMVLKNNNDYYIMGATKYAGGYEELREVRTNNSPRPMDYYTVYKGYRKSQSGGWVANGYYLTYFHVCQDVTQFGGEYAYKLSGCVLTTTENVNVSPALLSADGVWNLRLQQYKLDGTFLAENEEAYTSGDMPGDFYLPRPVDLDPPVQND